MRVPTQRVRELRHKQTEAEKAAWYLLRDRGLGLKFHRQYTIDNYVVDFYCFERRHGQASSPMSEWVHGMAQTFLFRSARAAMTERRSIHAIWATFASRVVIAPRYVAFAICSAVQAHV